MSTAFSAAHYASLYDEDEDEEFPLKMKSEHDFICDNCGSTQSYFDGSSQSCAICFTQAQSQKEEELDFEEINAIGARNAKGGLAVRHRRKVKGSGKGGRPRQPLQELDSSTPLPTIDVCLDALQQVLKGGVAAVSDILNLNQTSKKQLEQATKRIWMAYLKYWIEGAAFYSTLYPEVRFSLRDCFLMRARQVLLLRNLSFKVNQEIGKEEGDVQGHTETDQVDFEDEEFEEVSSVDHSSYPFSRQQKGSALIQVVNLHGRNGKREAALKIMPSMKLVAAVLLAAASSFGVAAYMIVSWIAEGRLTLLFAFSTMLSEELQKQTKHVRSFFEMQQLPRVQALHHCALTLYGLTLAEHPARISLIQSDDAVESMVGRIIDDLRLEDSKRVYEYSLAIMGLYLGGSRSTWLPPQLAQSCKVYRMFEFLAVIVVASKMCPGWGRQLYKRKQGMIPWSPADLVHLAEADIPDYLQFHEKFVGRNNSLIPGLQSSLSESRPSQGACDASRELHGLARKRKDIPVVGWSAAYKARKRRKHHNWYIGLRQKEAMWLEANCVGHYLMYPRNTEFHSTHPQYRLLLEHMSQITGVDPSKIHRETARLDFVLARACKKNVPTARMRGGKPMTDREEMRRAVVDIQAKVFEGRSCFEVSTVQKDALGSDKCG